jgi:soluble lytic murein transglycosylase-like protein
MPTRAEVEQLIRELAPGSRVPPNLLIRQCEAESCFNQAAKSPCGALGLFQLMPATAVWLKVDPLDWRANVRGGVTYMGRLYHQYGDYAKAFAAYNWGPGHLNRLLVAHPSAWREHLPTETRRYLARILEDGDATA